MRLGILGPLELGSEDHSLKVGGPRDQVVLAMLALGANHVISVEQLVDAVWAERPPSTARGQIQGCISGLRKLFADAGSPDAIDTRPSGYVLSVSAGELDSDRFAALVSAANQAVSSGQKGQAAATLRDALGLWRGPALQGVQSEIVRRSAALLDEARLIAVEERVRLDLELGRHDEVIVDLRSLVAENPLRERLYAFLMRALYRCGRQAEALEVSRWARRTLREELGVDPCQELQDLERDILNRDRSLDLPAVREEAGDPSDEPVTGPRQLPASTADFLGRERQRGQISAILSGDHRKNYAVPVIGIYGRGGVGKSTLALRIAHEWRDAYPDGHLYINLRDPDGTDRTAALLARFLRALGVSGSAIPEEADERAQMYRSRLADKKILLILDDASDERQVLPLLPGSPSCAVIVTSRTRLDCLDGAHWIGVDVFDRDTSMELLAKIVGRERLQAEPAAADELIQYCGALPLALRIAGARLASRPMWRVAELTRRMRSEVRRLDEFSHRGLELRSSIGLSYRTLPEQSQRLFRLFALITVKDFPSWTAAALLGTDLAEAEDTLEPLVDIQLLDTVRLSGQHIRYRMHDLIRVYAQERLLATESGQDRHDALTRLYGAWLANAEDAHAHEYGGSFTTLHGTAPRTRVADWADDDFADRPIDWLERERVALVATVRDAAAAGMHELSWDLALTMVSLFEIRGYYDDWRETAELAYAATEQAGNRLGSAAMLYSLGTFYVTQKQLRDAEQAFAAAEELFRTEGDVHGRALVLRNAALVDRLRGDVEPMLAKYELALAGMRGSGDLIGEATILRSLSKFRIEEGDSDAAHGLLSEALDLCARANYRRGVAQVESRFAELYLSTGQVVRARQTLTRVLATVQQLRDRSGEAHALYWLGLTRRREGQTDTAEATLVNALVIARQIGERLIEGQASYALGELCIARGDNEGAASHLVVARTRFVELGSALWLARTLILLSEVDEVDGLEASKSTWTAEERRSVRRSTVRPMLADLDRAAGLLNDSKSRQAAEVLRRLAQLRSALTTSEQLPDDSRVPTLRTAPVTAFGPSSDYVQRLENPAS
jgi:DNA-binding SARP family transcriptional activator